MLEAGDGEYSRATNQLSVSNKFEAVVMRWITNHGTFLHHQVSLPEQVHQIGLLFLELHAVITEPLAADTIKTVIETMRQLHTYTEAFGPNPDGSEGKMARHVAYGKAVDDWAKGIEQRGGVIGSSKKELDSLCGLLHLLAVPQVGPFNSRLFERVYNTVYEANHLLTQHGFLIDEPHMFSAFNPESTILVINPSWMDWITKRMVDQAECFVRSTISTSVMHELQNSLLTPELFDAYAIEIEVDLRSVTGRVVLTRKPTGLQEAINKYMKG